MTFHSYSEHQLEFAPEGGPCVLCDPPRTPPPAANDTAAAAPRPSLSDCVRHAMGYHCRRWGYRLVAMVLRNELSDDDWDVVRESLAREVSWGLHRVLVEASERMFLRDVVGAAGLLAEYADLSLDAWVAEQRKSIAQDGRV